MQGQPEGLGVKAHLQVALPCVKEGGPGRKMVAFPLASLNLNRVPQKHACINPPQNASVLRNGFSFWEGETFCGGCHGNLRGERGHVWIGASSKMPPSIPLFG